MIKQKQGYIAGWRQINPEMLRDIVILRILVNTDIARQGVGGAKLPQ